MNLISKIQNNFIRINTNKDFIRKSIILLSSTLISLFFGFLTNTFLTKLLGKEQFGNFAFIINILTFCQVLFNFGLYYTISRLVAITSDERKIKGYYLVGIVLSFFIFLIMAICLLGYSYFSNTLEESGLKTIMILSIPFSWLFLITNLNEFFLQGYNKINLLSITRVLPKIVFSIFLGYCLLFYKDASLWMVIIFNFISLFVTYVYIYYRLSPVISSFTRRLKEILVANKQFGFDIYLGALIASGSGSLSGILIGQFGVNNIDVGYFTLATLLASPLSLLPNIIATVQFRKFASLTRIPTETLYFTFGLCLLFLVLIWFLSKYLVEFIFGNEYLQTVEILKYLSLGYLLYGIGDFYNRFLLVKGKGKELRNASIIVGITLLLANVIFIQNLGAIGAAYARIISGLTYSIVILFFYKKEVR